MNNGWIKLHRKFMKWGWYQKSEMVHLFLHFLLLANHDENEWQGQKIKKGQFVTGRKVLSKDTGISQQTIRTCITRLKSTSEITTKPTNQFTLITITKYKDYQSKEERVTTKITKSLTNNQPTTNQQLTTNKNVKNDKNEKEDTLAFMQKLNYYRKVFDGFSNKGFSDKKLNLEFTKFIDYWTEPNQQGKQRWQLQKTFEVKRRLRTWLSKINKF